MNEGPICPACIEGPNGGWYCRGVSDPLCGWYRPEDNPREIREPPSWGAANSAGKTSNQGGNLIVATIGAGARVIPMPVKKKGAEAFGEEIVALLPYLRCFALKLTRDKDQAADLVQDLFVRALENQHQFESGTNLKGWLGTLMRNLFVDGRCSAPWRASLCFETIEDHGASHDGGQESRMAWLEAEAVLSELPAPIRRAVMMTAFGFTQAEIADTARCARDTVPSRVKRGRRLLEAVLDHGGVLRQLSGGRVTV